MMATDLLGALGEAGIKRRGIDVRMERYSSWHIGGPADFLCVVENEAQLQVAVRLANEHQVPWLVLGGGNNILISDAGISGLVILNRLRGISIETEDPDRAVLQCGAGVFFARAAQFSAGRGYTGMEWGIAIPGTVGGGVVNNAGAHSSDVARTLVSAQVMEAGGASRPWGAAELEYRYRESRLKEAHATQSRIVVTSCRFKIAPSDPKVALARVEELRLHRLATQPVKESSAGSTFKNPPGRHAGALIEQAGLKGHRVGEAQISELHANFILNLGHASAENVLELVNLARERVQDRFGITLEREFQLVGRWDSAEEGLPASPEMAAT